MFDFQNAPGDAHDKLAELLRPETRASVIRLRERWSEGTLDPCVSFGLCNAGSS